MKNIEDLNFIVFDENILPDLYKELKIKLMNTFSFKCSFNKQEFNIFVEYIPNKYSKTPGIYYNYLLDSNDYDLALLVCLLGDTQSLEEMIMKKWIAKTNFYL